MALLSPSSFKYVIGLSLSSRILVLIIQFLANAILEDHNADAYRNKYHQLLSSSVNKDLFHLPNIYKRFYSFIEGLTKWDAQYFIEISSDGYTSEQHLAFLPFYPIAISLVRQLIFEHTHINFDYLLSTSRWNYGDQTISQKALQDYIRTATVGVALNNFIFFPIASIALFTLTKTIKGHNEKYARNVVWWFCFNPASIFFSSCYSESLYAALTFTAMFIIEHRSVDYISRHQNLGGPTNSNNKEFVPLNHLNRLLYISLPSLPAFALATATRSNGLVNLGFLVYQFLLKYLPMTFLDRSMWSFIVYVSIVLEFIQDIIVLLMSSIVAASGYITFQIYSYIKFCAQENTPQKGMLNLRPDWCENLIPHPYGQVQSKYWNVGLFRYYEIKQLPNFLLAMPISYLMLIGSLQKSKEIPKTAEGRKQIAYYIQGVILTILCSISINVQVITRLLAASCPVIYWICADFTENTRANSKLLSTYFIGYFVLGTILYANFYPWT